MGRRKLNTPKNIILKESESDVDFKKIDSLNKLPNRWMRGFSLLTSDDIDFCVLQYKKFYNHAPKQGWIYTNSQEQKLLYLELEEGDKL